MTGKDETRKLKDERGSGSQLSAFSSPLSPTIPAALLRAGYEAERAAWQRELAQLQARLAAQQHIASALGANNAAHVAQIVRGMEEIATGLAKIEELIHGLGADGAATNGNGAAG